MEILKAYRFEIMPNGGQQAAMRRTIGCCRYVYNEALKVQNKRRAEGQKPLSEFDLVNLLPEWKAKDEWLKKAPAHLLQQALRDLHRAFVNFYEKRATFPVKQKKFKKDSFRFPAPRQFVVDQGNPLKPKRKEQNHAAGRRNPPPSTEGSPYGAGRGGCQKGKYSVGTNGKNRKLQIYCHSNQNFQKSKHIFDMI